MLKLWFEAIGSSSHAGNGWFFDEESAGISAAFGTGPARSRKKTSSSPSCS